MILIRFDPATLDQPSAKEWWENWSQRAEDATGKALDAFEEWLEKQPAAPFTFKFNNEIWTDLRDWLLENVFFQKCAYCEREISGYYGDAEHYRPKSAVKRKASDGKFQEPDCDLPDPVAGGIRSVKHPGYFWLAYDWRNLVPACVYCNSGLGKNERFDISKSYVVALRLDQAEVDALPSSAKPLQSKKWPGHYYPAPAALDDLEDPLLLNPLNAPEDRNPRKHIRFGVRGTVKEIDKSPMGSTSIETFQLKAEKLRQARQKAQEAFGDKYYDAMRTFNPLKPSGTKASTLIKQYARGQYPFSAAALDYLKILRDREAELMIPE